MTESEQHLSLEGLCNVQSFPFHTVGRLEKYHSSQAAVHSVCWLNPSQKPSHAQCPARPGQSLCRQSPTRTQPGLQLVLARCVHGLAGANPELDLGLPSLGSALLPALHGLAQGVQQLLTIVAHIVVCEAQKLVGILLAIGHLRVVVR